MMSEWQPIETAPKDGTEVILGNWIRKWVLVGYWHRGGWQVDSGTVTPTHWQAFPAPPPQPEAER